MAAVATYFSSKVQQVKLCINKNKDVGMGLDGFLSLDGDLFVPFLFHEVTSLHPLNFRNDSSTCTIIPIQTTDTTDTIDTRGTILFIVL